MEDTYLTITDISEGQFKDRGSRFIGFLYPVSSEAEVKERLAVLKKQYHDATHYCYAYTIGHTGPAQTRLNDDGEPSGSAARPIFGQLQSAGLSDVLAVVVRFFGGVKLGVPGLINAYKTTTKLAIENANVVERHVLECAEARLPYERMSALLNLLKKENAAIRDIGYSGNDALIRFEIRSQLFKALEEKISLLPIVSFRHTGTK